MRPLAIVFVGCLGLAIAVACSEASAPAEPDAPPAASAPPSAPTEPAVATAPAERREPPLPAFEGVTLDDERLSVSDWIGRRFVVFLFNPEVADAGPVADALAAIADLRGEHNFRILGVAQGSTKDKARRFLADHGLDVPTLLDPNGRFGAGVGARVPVGLLVVDAEGYLVHGQAAPEGVDELAPLMEAELREWLRLPAEERADLAGLDTKRRAPDFVTSRLEGGEPFDSTSLRGRPAILIFFLHTCPHCHSALRFFKEALADLPEESRPALVGISVLDRTLSVKQRLEEDDLDFFPVLLDPDRSVQKAYGAVSGVPVIFGIDAEGRILWRVDGWRDEREPPLTRMRLARLAGQPVPMLLHRTGFSGNEFCNVCHETQASTWELTNHASAFDTLVRHGADRNAECVGCHVVGFGQEGGWSLARPAHELEDVGCETCHGRGGPHLSTATAGRTDYEPVCVTCHNPKHSLGFDYAEFLPRVSHAANAALFAGLSAEEKRELLAARRAPREDILASDAAYVGSEACKSCHEAEYAAWSEQPHAAATKTLAAGGHAGKVECLECHTTAFGKPGGFPEGGTPSEHPALVGVGCESCHGPGGEHVKEDARRIGTIVSLGDKCDSCVILQICGSCHDDANDPGFEFEVLDKIEAQRHGTIEAGTGEPLDPDTRASLPRGAILGALEEALRRTAPGSERSG